jgi:hypothetical protein
MDQQPADTWTFRLSREEIALLVELAGAHTIPTLGTHPYGTQAPERIEQLRQAAARSLAERGLVTVEDAAITEIDTLLKGAILFCVYPQSMAAIVSRYAPAPELRSEAYYQVPDATVYHLADAGALHELTLIAPPVAVPAMLAERLGLYALEQDSEFSLPYEDFERAQRQAAGGDSAAALQAIAAHIDDGEIARLLIDALAHPHLRCVIEQIPDIQAGRVATTSFIVSAASSWIIGGLERAQPGESITIQGMTLPRLMAAVQSAG